MHINTQTVILIAIAIVAPLTGCHTAPAPQLVKPAASASAPTTQSMVPHHPSTHPTVLMFNPRSIDAIMAGTKTSTTRKGIREFPTGTTIAADADTQIHLIILSAVPKKLADLTEKDAQSDGSESVEAMKAALMRNYPGITDDDTVTVITFRVAHQQP